MDIAPDPLSMFQNVRDVLELLSFVGTIVLGIFGFFIFLQLRMAKDSLNTAKKTLETTNEDMQTRIRREAIVLAAQQTERFAKEIIPVTCKHWDDLTRTGIELPDWHLENELFDNSSLKEPKKAEEWLATLEKNHKVSDLIEVLNQHESFAMYFVGGAADEEIVYPSLANVYCSHIRTLAPLLVNLRFGPAKKAAASGPYQNTIALYQTWSARLESHELEIEAAKLSAKREGIHTSSIPVFGTAKEK